LPCKQGGNLFPPIRFGDLSAAAVHSKQGSLSYSDGEFECGAKNLV